MNGIPNQDPSAWKDDHYRTHVGTFIAAAHNALAWTVSPQRHDAIKTRTRPALYLEYGLRLRLGCRARHDATNPATT